MATGECLRAWLREDFGFGKLLTQVHATAVTEAVAEYLPAEDHTHDRAAFAARVLDRRLHEVVDEPAEVGDLADHLVRAHGS